MRVPSARPACHVSPRIGLKGLAQRSKARWKPGAGGAVAHAAHAHRTSGRGQGGWLFCVSQPLEHKASQQPGSGLLRARRTLRPLACNKERHHPLEPLNRVRCLSSQPQVARVHLPRRGAGETKCGLSSYRAGAHSVRTLSAAYAGMRRPSMPQGTSMPRCAWGLASQCQGRCCLWRTLASRGHSPTDLPAFEGTIAARTCALAG